MIYLELEQWTTTPAMILMGNSGARRFLGRGRTGGRRRLNHLVGGVAGTGAATGAVVGTGDGRSNCRMYWSNLQPVLSTRPGATPGKAALARAYLAHARAVLVLSTVKITAQ